MQLSLVFDALREPEAFAVRWGREQECPPVVLAALAGTAAFGVGTYAAMLHAWRGGAEAITYGLGATIAAGLGWSAAMPALIILGGLLGSKLSPRAAALASLITVSFGGLAMLASVPVLWFFELTTTGEPLARGFAMLSSTVGVGLCMTDVFLRVMRALEGSRMFNVLWFGLFGALSLEMFILFGLHQVR